ncbi:unnamed protein product, partial [Closterium sp. NIES-53]
LSRAGVAIFDLDYDAILATMYAVSTSDEGDCYLCLPPDPGGEAAALGACEATALGASASTAPGAGESALSGTASAQVFHTFTLDSGASRSFFRDRTTLTPLLSRLSGRGPRHLRDRGSRHRSVRGSRRRSGGPSPPSVSIVSGSSDHLCRMYHRSYRSISSSFYRWGRDLSRGVAP